MKKILDFWNRDIINKLIVGVLAVLGIGLLACLYFLWTLPTGSLFYGALFPSRSTPTQLSTATVRPTPTTEFFPSVTPLPAPSSTGISSPLLTPFTSVTPPPSPLPAQNQSTETTAPTAPLAASIPAVTSAAATACIPNHPPETGRVVGVLDGNTIKVLLDRDGKIYVVRYIGIAVPAYGETQELYGRAAELDNFDLVFAQKVSLFGDNSDKDPAGRLLRYVTMGDRFINLVLLQHGYATAASVPPNTACDAVFKNAEQTARQSQIGRWVATPTPLSP
ncbi:MAG TPA: thermonuclease family protein [Anaerolineales bacterium]|nr:thermonuclease family protein [Anaerolineales bacterium]